MSLLRHLGSRFATLAATVILTGCTPSVWMAHRLIQAPTTFPKLAAPPPRVYFSLPGQAVARLPLRDTVVGDPAVRMVHRVVEPADYSLRLDTGSWGAGRRDRALYGFTVRHPAATNRYTGRPRGTVFLLHGYGLDHTSMLPWAFQLAGEGWRCVVPDLRGHGKSDGRTIGFGTLESRDLRDLTEALRQDGTLIPPVLALGVSYGAVVGLHWLREDPQVVSVVAVAPYAQLADAIGNIRSEYAPWLPAGWLRSGARRIPRILGVPPDDLDPVTWIDRVRRPVLLVAATGDAIAPADAVDHLHLLSPPGSHLRVLHAGTHEDLAFRFGELTQPVGDWMKAAEAGQPAATNP